MGLIYVVCPLNGRDTMPTTRTAASAASDPPNTATTARRRALLESLGLMEEDEVAALFGCSVKALRNRARVDKPDSVKLSGKRLYPRDAVLAFIERRLERALPSRAA